MVKPKGKKQPAPEPVDPMERAAEALDDAQVVEWSSQLAKLAVADAIQTYKRGTPAQRATLTKTFLTALSKNLGDRGGDEDKAAMRDELQRLLGVVEP